MARPSQVPGEAEWAGYEDDLDVRYAYHLYFGKTTDEVKYDFRDLVITQPSWRRCAIKATPCAEQVGRVMTRRLSLSRTIDPMAGDTFV